MTATDAVRTGARKCRVAFRVAATAAVVAREQLPGARPPQTRDDVPPAAERLTSEWLTAALCADHAGARIVDFEVGDGSDGTSCRRPLRVTYNDAGRAAGLPEMLFTKTTATLRSRLSTGLADMPRSECLFYNRIRATLDFAGPMGYYADFDRRTLRSMVIMEDVTVTRRARFGDVTEPVSRTEAESMVEQMAAYHAAFWDDARLRNEFAAIPTARQFQDRMDRMIDFEQRCQVGLDRAQDVIPDEIRRRRDELWPNLRKTFEIHERRPMTLLHQDTHPGNWFRTPDQGMALCDWHGLARGLWAIDVAYALSCGLAIDDRRAWERDLLGRYLDTLSKRGVTPPPFDDAIGDYRRELLHGLVYWLFTIGKSRLHQEFQTDQVCRNTIERAAAAVADHETFDRFRGA